jgi:serine/threonine-protein kinase HipA
VTDRLLVLLYGDVIGVLEREDAGDAATFAYSASYAADGEVALSARLPIRQAAFAAERVEPYLAGLLPENAETRALWASRLDADPDDAFAMLAQMGWDCPGAVQFCREEELDSLLEQPSDYMPVDDADIAERLRNLTEQPASWTMPEEHWSLGGQQEKFALAQREGHWYEAHGAAATTHIIKPGIRHLHSQALIEHVTMTASGALGIDMARTEMTRFEDQWAIVVERFDRVISSDNDVIRFHQEDMCQAIGRMPARKYESRGGPQLRDMMTLIGKQASSPEDDARALADFLVINLVAGAPDGHSKNISMIRSPEGNWIAPLYDLATGLSYDTDKIDRSIALSIGGERQLSRIGPKQWAKAASIMGIDLEQLESRVAYLATHYPAHFEAALAEVQSAPGADEVAVRALPAIAEHCSKVLDGLSGQARDSNESPSVSNHQADEASGPNQVTAPTGS